VNLNKALGKSYKGDEFKNNPKWDFLYIAKKKTIDGEETPEQIESGEEFKVNEEEFVDGQRTSTRKRGGPVDAIKDDATENGDIADER
jgi:hypothetical protein